MQEADFAVLTTKAGHKDEIRNSLVLGLKPRTLCVLGEHSTTELPLFALYFPGQPVTTSVAQLGFVLGILLLSLPSTGITCLHCQA